MPPMSEKNSGHIGQHTEFDGGLGLNRRGRGKSRNQRQDHRQPSMIAHEFLPAGDPA
jgi:hypothetical protein